MPQDRMLINEINAKWKMHECQCQMHIGGMLFQNFHRCSKALEPAHLCSILCSSESLVCRALMVAELLDPLRLDLEGSGRDGSSLFGITSIFPHFLHVHFQ